MRSLGKMLATLVVSAWLWPAAAAALSVEVEGAARGWFFSANGTIQDTDIEALGFDGIRGQPELRGALVLNERFHFRGSYLRIRRSEEGTISGTILGILRFDNDVSMELQVDDVRGHLGYSVLTNDWIDVEPFVEVAYLREETTIVNRTFGQTSRQEENAVFPLPGLTFVIAPSSPLHVEVRAAGIGIDRGHLIDVVSGLEALYRFAFLGVGYRYVDFLFEDSDGVEQADAQLKGVYLEGGVRF